MNDKKNCIVLYYESTESWLDKIPKNINVLKKIELKEDDTIENINEKIKDNFCVNSLGTNIEVIIFLSCSQKNNIEMLFYENNFAIYLPTIIEVNDEEKLDKIIKYKISDIWKDIVKKIKNTNNYDISFYFNMLYQFKSFFDKIHGNCGGKNGCKIKNINKYYEFYKCLPWNDVENILQNIKSINNIFGFFSIMDKGKFIFNLEYVFKYNIINKASNIITNLESSLPSVNFNGLELGHIVDYTLQINEYYNLSKKERKNIIEAILSKKLVRIE